MRIFHADHHFSNQADIGGTRSKAANISDRRSCHACKLWCHVPNFMNGRQECEIISLKRLYSFLILVNYNLYVQQVKI